MVVVSNYTIEDGATLSTTSTEIVAQRDSRAGFVITNLDSSITVYLAFDKDAIVEKGVALLAGTSMAFGGDLTNVKAIYAIAASGTPKVSWTEFCNQI